MTKQEAHKILDQCLDEAKGKKFFGELSFIVRFQKGEIRQITDQGWKRTWVDPHNIH